MEPIVDVFFPVTSQAPLPADHGYVLYAALSRIVPELHREDGMAVHPIAGRLVGDRQMRTTEFSRLAIRLAINDITRVLPLAGKQLNLADRVLRLGVPSVQALVPATALRSRVVTTKGADDADRFLKEVRRQLDLLRVSPEVEIMLPKLPLRRTVRIKGNEIVGHEVVLSNLSADESLSIQVAGLGGRRHMGCGLFVPVRGAGVSNDE